MGLGAQHLRAYPSDARLEHTPHFCAENEATQKLPFEGVICARSVQ
jgi:hypothetical protein